MLINAIFGLVVSIEPLLPLLITTIVFVLLGLIVFALAFFVITKVTPFSVRKEIEDLLRQKAEAPLGGIVGVELVNVLEVNLALRERYAAPAPGSTKA